MRKICVLLIFFLVKIQVQGAPLVIDQSLAKDTVNLLPYLNYLYSANQDTVYKSVANSELQGRPFSRGTYKSKRYHFFSFEVENRTRGSQDLIVQLPKVDYARLQLYANGRLQVVVKTGDLIPFIDKSIPYNSDGFEEFRVTIDPGSYTFILMVSDKNLKIPLQSAFMFSFDNWKNSLHDNFSYREVGQGIFHGILWLMILFSLYYFLVTKEKSAVRFAISSLSMSIYLMIVNGFVPPVFPAADPKILIGLNHFILLLSLYAFLSFMVYFTGSRERYPGIAAIITRSKWVILVLYVASLIFLFNYKIINYYYLFRSVLGSYLVAAWLAYTVFMLIKSKKDRAFLLSSLTMLAGTIISLILFFYHPERPAIYLYLQIGYVISLIVFSFLMVETYRTVLSHKISFQSRLIKEVKKNEQLQKEQNKVLEKEVVKRTTEIQAQNEELVQQQEELAAQRDMLENQSKMIEKQNNSLRSYNIRLEKDVRQRTHQLEEINKELILQNQQLEQFSFILAHNLRSPVARLQGLTNLFGITGEKDLNEIIARISYSANDLNEVLRDLNAILDIKRGEGPVKTAISINSLFERCISRYEDQIVVCEIDVHTDIQEDNIVTVKAYLESIVLNLISNAIKYRSQNEKAIIRFVTKKIGDQVEITVEDNGIGIDLKANRSKVFGIYQRFHTHIEGKGLGLYLVKVQVDALRGSIKVESKLNKGTRFTILLPG